MARLWHASRRRSMPLQRVDNLSRPAVSRSHPHPAPQGPTIPCGLQQQSDQERRFAHARALRLSRRFYQPRSMRRSPVGMSLSTGENSGSTLMARSYVTHRESSCSQDGTMLLNGCSMNGWICHVKCLGYNSFRSMSVAPCLAALPSTASRTWTRSAMLAYQRTRTPARQCAHGSVDTCHVQRDCVSVTPSWPASRCASTSCQRRALSEHG